MKGGSLVIVLTQYAYNAKVEVLNNHIKSARLYRKVLCEIRNKSAGWDVDDGSCTSDDALFDKEMQVELKKKTQTIIDAVLLLDSHLYCTAVSKDTIADAVESIITFNVY